MRGALQAFGKVLGWQMSIAKVEHRQRYADFKPRIHSAHEHNYDTSFGVSM